MDLKGGVSDHKGIEDERRQQHERILAGRSGMKPCVMQLLVALRLGGAERLALSLLRHGQDHYAGLVAGLFHEPEALAGEADGMHLPWVALRAEQCGKIRAIGRLYKTLRQHRVALIHVQAGYLLQYALPAARLAGVPVVYTEHALHSLRTKPRLRRFVRLAAPFLHGIVCVNEPVADYFIRDLGIDRKRVRVIPNGVDAALFSPQGEHAAYPWGKSAGNGLFLFGNVARLNEAKDHRTLLHAFAQVRRTRPHVHLLLVGDGEERTNIEKLIDALGIEDCTHMAGACLNVPEVLRSLDAFVLSSRREGMPMAVLEAMACGLPVVSTEVGGLAALNEDGERVVLVPAETPSALAAAMERLVDDAALRQRLAVQGREYVVTTRSGAAMAERYFALYGKRGLA